MPEEIPRSNKVPHDDAYEGRCFVCGATGTFVRQHNSLREGYSCTHCKASLRYRGQAELLLQYMAVADETCLADLAGSGALDELEIFEPGLTGPFRSIFANASTYLNSFYWDDVETGTEKDGTQCQDLHDLTFADESFDYVITSDIMEHVRRPWTAFQEIQRVLKPGGYHVFSIPVQMPMATHSKMRVDTSGDEDVYLEEPHYHGDGIGGKSLVYIDYGWDFLRNLMENGGQITVHSPSDEHPEARKLLTFATRKSLPNMHQSTVTEICNICAGEEFKEGPLGRLSLTGKLPTCANCGSLERHRIIRHAWQQLPMDKLSGLHALMFSSDPSVDADWFQSLETSIYGTSTTLDIQAIDRADNRYDVVICNHVLEHVEQDVQAFQELMRIVKDDGFVQMTVPSPINRKETEDWGFPRHDFHGHYRHYGLDLIERFGSSVPGIKLCYVRSSDPATDIEDYVFFWSKSSEVMDQLNSSFAGKFEVMHWGG